MFQSFKKITDEDLRLAIENQDLDTILTFVKKNKKKIVFGETKRGVHLLRSYVLFRININKVINLPSLYSLKSPGCHMLNGINNKIIQFPFPQFKAYVQTLKKENIPPENIIIDRETNLLHYCIEQRKLEHTRYLIETGLFSIQPKDKMIWTSLLLGPDIGGPDVFKQLFHLIMENGGDLNQTYKSDKLIVSILKKAPVPLDDELKMYFHTLSEETMKVYKATKLQILQNL